MSTQVHLMLKGRSLMLQLCCCASLKAFISHKTNVMSLLRCSGLTVTMVTPHSQKQPLFLKSKRFEKIIIPFDLSRVKQLSHSI